MAAIVVDTTKGLGEIRGIHGGAGTLGWARLATGNMMFSPLDAFDLAHMPPGSEAGLHEHTRTEELFFVLQGAAEITLGDEQVTVGPGDTVLTAFGGRQAVKAVGDEEYRMLILEALPPEIVAALPAHRPAAEV